jgi:hypothetical protein
VQFVVKALSLPLPLSMPSPSMVQSSSVRLKRAKTSPVGDIAIGLSPRRGGLPFRTPQGTHTRLAAGPARRGGKALLIRSMPLLRLPEAGLGLSSKGMLGAALLRAAADAEGTVAASATFTRSAHHVRRRAIFAPSVHRPPVGEDAPSFVGEGRVAPDHGEVDSRQISGQALSQAINEILLIWVAGHVEER